MQNKQTNKLKITYSTGFYNIDAAHILYISSSSGGYCEIMLNTNQKIVTSKRIGFLSESLSHNNFLKRIDRSLIVNVNEVFHVMKNKKIIEFQNTKGGLIQLNCSTSALQELNRIFFGNDEDDKE